MCTRTCFGLFVGYICLIGYGIATICCILVLTNKEMMDATKQGAASADVDIKPGLVKSTIIVYLVVGSVMTVISGLLITGINKRRHRYMSPWLLLAVITIVICAIVAIIGLFSAVKRTERFMTSVCAIGLQIVFIYPIYTLYRDFRDEKVDIVQRA